ncbi:hypothetical protein REPUB_Repub01dG0240700 [Reevesia pubescens]
MATSPLNIQPSYHARSNSLPSRKHPIASQIDENLSRLRASEATSTSSSIGSSPRSEPKWVEELFDGSLMVLDVCSTAKDALLQTKETIKEFQSILRRRRGAEMGLANEVRKYLTSRKAVKKAICKALKNLKQMETKFSTSSFNKDGPENGVVSSILREVEAVKVKSARILIGLYLRARRRIKVMPMVTRFEVNTPKKSRMCGR